MPVGLDPAHPFPQVANKSLQLHRAAARQAMPSGARTTIAIVKVPRVLPRVIRMPPKVAGEARAVRARCPA